MKPNNQIANKKHCLYAMWESKLLGCFMHCKKTKNCNISDYYFSIKLKNTILFIGHRTIFEKNHITIGLTYLFYYECVDLEFMQINNIFPTQKVYCFIYTSFKCKLFKHNIILPFFYVKHNLQTLLIFLDLVNFSCQMFIFV